MGAVSDIAGSELKKDVAALRGAEAKASARARVERLLKATLTADAAVQIALLNNYDLQAEYNALGISEAVLVQATLPPSPTFSLSSIAGGGGLEIERQIIVSILALATLPARAEIAGDRFRQAQLHAALATLRVAAETRGAFYRTVAARVLIGTLGEAQHAGETAVTLANRLTETGAMTRLDQAREQVFYAELTAQLSLARQRAAAERERLVRAMGLSGADLDFRLPGALPRLPARPQALPRIEVEALRRRVDLQIARIETEALAKSYGLTNAVRFINLVDVSGISKTAREPGGPRFNEGGAGVEFQVPLFDFGEARLRQAEETYMQSVNRLTAKAVNVRSEAREAYQSYRAAYDIARQYRREVLPLRKLISDETLLRYNAMQIDVFALLAESRQRITSTIAAIEAERNFWLASANLSAAMSGGGISNETTTTPAVAISGDAPAHDP
jgi:outer membrane protein TolC